MTQTYSLGEECLEINYYGVKRMIEALIPLLDFSDSPRIVNVSSSSGKLKMWQMGRLGQIKISGGGVACCVEGSNKLT
ncbi:hypothetical protein CsSME_00012681 [Camellia sinensis var. sinensis]